jgi:hypothetical protein
MDKTDDALEAEWLSPEDLVEIDDEDERRVSDIRALRDERRRVSEIRDLRDQPRTEPTRATRRRAYSPMRTAFAVARLALFFTLGVGLGSIFALGVASILEIRKETPRVAPARAPGSDPPIDSAGATIPEFGKPGRAL